MKYYFIGIKGSGMSALAMLLKDCGHEVIGSDVEEYIFTQVELSKRGISIFNFNCNNFNSEYIVIIGHNFIDSDNEEVVKAKRENKWYEYNDFISELIKQYYSIAVCGTHGKTTTTSLVSLILNEIDECGYLIGDGSASLSALSNYFVFEACEHKEHFLKYKSNIILITNIDYDHVDYYKSKEDYIKAFHKFIDNAIDRVIVNGDDANMAQLKGTIKYGLEDYNDYIAKNVKEDEKGISYDLYNRENFIKRVSFPFFGHHMVYNTLGAISVGLTLDINIDRIVQGVKKFNGVKRRFNEIKIEDNVYIDDYAHHPKEIASTINSVRQKYPNKKIVAFFRGDRYSRVQYFASDIATSLAKADDCYVLPFPLCSEKEEGIDIDETYLSLFNEKIKFLNNDEYIKISSYDNCVYVFMSSKNMKEVENKIIELKFNLGKQ